MIKIQAYQIKGIKTDKVEDEFEFCCWQSLYNWLNGFKKLHKCPICNSQEQKKKCTCKIPTLRNGIQGFCVCCGGEL